MMAHKDKLQSVCVLKRHKAKTICTLYIISTQFISISVTVTTQWSEKMYNSYTLRSIVTVGNVS